MEKDIKRVSVYIDGANFYGGVTSINPKYTDTKFDFENYIKKIISWNVLVEVYYYNGSLKRQIQPHLFKKQQRFFSRLRSIRNFNVIILKRKPRINEYGEEYHTIKGDDICLALDMQGDAYEDKYDKAILISSDGDFVPLIKKVRKLDKEVDVCYFKDCVAKELLKEANKISLIDKKILKKYFFKVIKK